MRYFVVRKENPIQFTRSRPYHKDDNAHVEQKNWTHVRQLFGYHRFEKRQLVAWMNDLYSHEWSLYQNHFCPSMKVIKKQKINSRYHKKYDYPKTPYRRLVDSNRLSAEARDLLIATHEKLNPFELKRIIDRKVRYILRVASVTSSMSQRY